MFRNREIRFLILTMSAISLIAVITASFISWVATIHTLITTIILIGCSIGFTRWRYKELEKLSSYLRQISGGDYSLDVRDNYEGELSILKSDIYKVTLMLSEQGSLLRQDKIQLTDAISDISHQLKTPITSMTVMAELLSDVALPTTKRTEFTRNIHIQLQRIDWLVTSLLKFSKIDAGTVQFKKDEIVVSDLIRNALEPVLIPIEIKEQTFLIKGEEAVSFLGDLNWTIEALINILKNCVEHTGAGGTIEIAYAKNVLYTEIVITDNGKGISKEDLAYLFKRFYKGKNASDDSIGIGLAMAYSIITSQHGDIEVTSDEGRGTQFRIKFYNQSPK
jgi:signal transduction histidine kinase